MIPDKYAAKKSKNTVIRVDYGRCEIKFASPLNIKKHGRRFSILAGWRKGSEIQIEGDQIIGVRCHPDGWRLILTRMGADPKALEGFEATLRKSK